MIEGVDLIFTSTTGRSGTAYLANLINSSAINATSEHDPYPRGYGAPIVWHENGKHDKLLKLARAKCKRLERGKKYNKILGSPFLRKATGREKTTNKVYIGINKVLRNYFPTVEIKEIYIESTHAFIKSFGEAMFELVPQLGLIHITRNPLHVAKSFFNRGSVPGPNNPYLLDPRSRKNILRLDVKMTDFQKCLWYWFESELRHYHYIKEHDVKRVYDIETENLGDIEYVKDMFKYFNIRYDKIVLQVGRNKNKMSTTITEQDLHEAQCLLEKIPAWVIDIVKKTVSYKKMENLL